MINNDQSRARGTHSRHPQRGGIASIRDLSARLGRVPTSRVRRDVARLAKEGALRREPWRRVEGRTVRPAAPAACRPAEDIGLPIGDIDAIVLPPIEGKGAETLAPDGAAAAASRSSPNPRRRRAASISAPTISPPAASSARRRRAISRQDRDGADPARLAGGAAQHAGALRRLPRRLRRSLRRRRVRHWRVDGRGSFRSALRASLDALQAHPDINVALRRQRPLDPRRDRGLRPARARRRQRLLASAAKAARCSTRCVAGGKLVACCRAVSRDRRPARASTCSPARSPAGRMPAEVETPHAVADPRQPRRLLPARRRRLGVDRPTRLAELPPVRPSRSTARGRRRPRIGFVPALSGARLVPQHATRDAAARRRARPGAAGRRAAGRHRPRDPARCAGSSPAPRRRRSRPATPSSSTPARWR